MGNRRTAPSTAAWSQIPGPSVPSPLVPCTLVPGPSTPYFRYPKKARNTLTFVHNLFSIMPLEAKIDPLPSLCGKPLPTLKAKEIRK